jgi:ATP-dependent NAD(P)H-hydrate dehydratase
VICEPLAGQVIKTYSPGQLSEPFKHTIHKLTLSHRSADLIVHGILDPTHSLEEIKKSMKDIMSRLVTARHLAAHLVPCLIPPPILQHVLIIGPGLSRTDHMLSCARIAFELAKESEMGVVVDADGLFLVQVGNVSR